MFRVCVCVCLFFYFFWAVPRARKKSDFFTPFFAETKKYETLFSLGTNRERERENVVFEEALS